MGYYGGSFRNTMGYNVGADSGTSGQIANALLTATPASGPAPRAVAFETWVPQGDTNAYTVNFGDGTSSGPMSMRPSGVSCVINRPCYVAIASTSHTYTSAGSYTATLIGSGLTSVASTSIAVSGTAPVVARFGRQPRW
jgi:hypothetical protein